MKVRGKDYDAFAEIRNTRTAELVVEATGCWGGRVRIGGSILVRGGKLGCVAK